MHGFHLVFSCILWSLMKLTSLNVLVDYVCHYAKYLKTEIPFVSMTFHIHWPTIISSSSGNYKTICKFNLFFPSKFECRALQIETKLSVPLQPKVNFKKYLWVSQCGALVSVPGLFPLTQCYPCCVRWQNFFLLLFFFNLEILFLPFLSLFWVCIYPWQD